MDETPLDVIAFATTMEGGTDPRISAYVPDSMEIGDSVNANVGGNSVVMQIWYFRKEATGRPLVDAGGNRLVDLMRVVSPVN